MKKFRGLIIALFILMLCFWNLSYSNTKQKNTLILFVPNTLKTAVNDVATQFKKEKGTKIEINSAGTHILLTQLKNQAKCDVFMSADKRYADELVKDGYAASYKEFAKTRLCIVSSTDKVKKFEDIAKKGVKLCIADEVSPIGLWTKQLLDKISKDRPSFYKSIEKNIISKDFQITDVLSKALSKEVDAAIVYKTDALRYPEKLKIISIPNKYYFPIYHYVAVLSKSTNKKIANDFLKFLLSNDGKKFFTKYGYE